VCASKDAAASLARVQNLRAKNDGRAYPSTHWLAFVSASQRWFAPTITAVLAEEPSAESFDEFLPRHPLPTDRVIVAVGPGALSCRYPRYLPFDH